MIRALLIGMALLVPTAASAGPRIALLIGEGDYYQPPQGVHGQFWPQLTNPTNDVVLVAGKLKAVGFDTTVLINKNRADIQAAIAAFAQAAAGADDAVFYYAGHGFEYDRHNYIVPIDAPAVVDSTVLNTALIDLDKVANDTAKAHHANLLFLDACRTLNPDVHQLPQSKPYADDLEFSTALPIAVIYSTARGEAAYDAPDDPSPAGYQPGYSPFAWFLAQSITLPHTSFNDAFTMVNAKVQQSTRVEGADDQGPQSPYMLSSLSDVFYFRPQGGLAAASATPTLAPPAQPQPAPSQPAGRTVATGRGRGIGGGLALSMDYLARTDEPVIVSSVLADHSPQALVQMAEAGDPIAAYLVGCMFEWGHGADRDLTQARAWLEQAAKSELAPAQLELGYFLEANGGGPDKARGRQLMEAAAAKGFAKAQAHLANLLMTDQVAADYARGRDLYVAAASQDYPQALFALAWLGDPLGKARLETLAAGGDVASHQWLCELAARDGIAKGLAHCQAAAKGGSYLAQARLAIAYSTGDGVAKDPKEARHWARVALPHRELPDDLRQRLAGLDQ